MAYALLVAVTALGVPLGYHDAASRAGGGRGLVRRALTGAYVVAGLLVVTELTDRRWPAYVVFLFGTFVATSIGERLWRRRGRGGSASTDSGR